MLQRMAVKVVNIGKGLLAGSNPAVKLAAEAVQCGEVIAVPTDTIYGLAALVQSKTAVERLYNIKGRQPSKPIAICVGEVQDVQKWAEVTVSDQVLMDLLPGPVTLVFKRSDALNNSFNPDTELVGVRIPDYPFLRDVCRLAGGPLALTSANYSAESSTLEVSEFAPLHSRLHTVFDGGRLGETEEARLGSTVVDLSQHGSYRFIREGCAREHVEKVMKIHYLEPR